MSSGPPDEELFMFMIGVRIEIGITGIICTERHVNLVVKALLQKAHMDAMLAAMVSHRLPLLRLC